MKRSIGSMLFAALSIFFITGHTSRAQNASCTFAVSPNLLYFQLPGGTAEVYVKGSAPACTFAARSAYPWITVSVKQEQGDGKTLVTVAGNTGLTHRVGNVLVDGEEVSVVQYGPRISGTGN